MLWSLHGSPIKVEYLSKALLTLTDKTKQKHNQPLPLHFSMLMISTWPRRTASVALLVKSVNFIILTLVVPSLYSTVRQK